MFAVTRARFVGCKQAHRRSVQGERDPSKRGPFFIGKILRIPYILTSHWLSHVPRAVCLEEGKPSGIFYLEQFNLTFMQKPDVNAIISDILDEIYPRPEKEIMFESRLREAKRKVIEAKLEHLISAVATNLNVYHGRKEAELLRQIAERESEAKEKEDYIPL